MIVCEAEFFQLAALANFDQKIKFSVLFYSFFAEAICCILFQPTAKSFSCI